MRGGSMTVPIDDGGAAFPCEAEGFMNQDASGNIVAVTEMLKAHKGMTLRDYFASKALPTVIMEMWGDGCHGATPEDAMAGCAYKIADAMLEARKEKR